MTPFRVRAASKSSRCLFLVGMRVNNLWNPIHIILTFFMMWKVLKSLETKKPVGYCGYEVAFGRNIIIPTYWTSKEALIKYASSSRGVVHGEARKSFVDRVLNSGTVGIWHETYCVTPGNFESLYINMPEDFGLLNDLPAQPAETTMKERFDNHS